MSTSAPVPVPGRPSGTRAPAVPHRTTPGSAGRRAGHVLGALINLALLLAVLVWPGWEVLPFLTAEFDQVVGVLTVSLTVSALAEVVYVLADRRRVKAAGDLVTLAVSLLVTIRLLTLFPFDFGSASGWATAVRVLLVLAVVGTVVGMVAALVNLLRDEPATT